MISEKDSSRKRLAQNTLLLYFRMLITMGVGLYTSRIILNILGVFDYGIYNVVGGVVTMAAFLNAGLTAATQRFISYEIGSGNTNRLTQVFSSAILIHFIISIVVFIVAESIGLWFINNCLNIASERMNAANWVYQFSIFSFIVTILSVPYNSCIVAHERMRIFAYISILEAILKLSVAFSLLLFNMDKLILYGCLCLVVSIIIRLCYSVYCKLHFMECRTKITVDKKLLRDMTIFSGWSMFGNLGLIGRDQGANIILNIFTGAALNAARGVGLQVSSLVNQFSVNFTMALNPQITKSYASGDIEKCSSLVYEGAKFSFYLLAIISIPVIVYSDYVLRLWLGSVPSYTSQFLILSLLVSLLYCLSQTVTIAIHATKKLKVFQLGICILMFSELPFVWLILALKMPPYLIMIPQIVSSVIAIFFRFYLLKRYVPLFSWKRYIFDVLVRSFSVVILCFIVSHYLKEVFPETFISLIFVTFLSFMFSGLMIFLFGLSNSERKTIIFNVQKLIRKK